MILPLDPKPGETRERLLNRSTVRLVVAFWSVLSLVVFSMSGIFDALDPALRIAAVLVSSALAAAICSAASFSAVIKRARDDERRGK